MQPPYSHQACHHCASLCRVIRVRETRAQQAKMEAAQAQRTAEEDERKAQRKIVLEERVQKQREKTAQAAEERARREDEYRRLLERTRECVPHITCVVSSIHPRRQHASASWLRLQLSTDLLAIVCWKRSERICQPTPSLPRALV